MTRSTIVGDRIAALITAILCFAVGAAALLWWHGDWAPLRGPLSTTIVVKATASSWWPWGAGALGLLLVILGLRWLVAHLPQRSVGPLLLGGSSPEGRLTADTSAVVTTAGDVFADTLGVRSVRSRMMRDRGRRVVQFRTVIEPDADLGLISIAADAIASDLSRLTGRPDLVCRINLRVAARARAQTRVS